MQTSKYTCYRSIIEKIAEASVELIDASFDSLMARRRDLELGASHRRETDFVTCILGGAWARLNRGCDFDCILARGVGGSTSRWCTVYSLPLSNRFSFAKFGDILATAMAR